MKTDINNETKVSLIPRLSKGLLLMRYLLVGPAFCEGLSFSLGTTSKLWESTKTSSMKYLRLYNPIGFSGC